ncbi:MAG TPA: 4Fe-4S dicluster domain-containing protein [Deltaproteobacteria bacterium]|nr:4Fe-4S dicluster domain-containing protein [Deltaproteobacteria bacterium]
MKSVVVRPERCVGCMQCMIACAVAHSRSKTLFGAIQEHPKPSSRIHIGAGLFREAFPNRCRHCDPAPCYFACLPGAIFRSEDGETVVIDPGRCINCASCAMVCPFGVIRYHQDVFAPPNKVVAIKCDNCMERQEKGMVPACVEACKTGALVFEDVNVTLAEKTAEVSRAASAGIVEGGKEPFNPMNVLNKHREILESLAKN